MSITHPPLINVNPGDPITSEGWNNIILAVKKLYAVHNRVCSQLAISVLEKVDKQVVRNALVTLVSNDFPTEAMNYAGADIQCYLQNHIFPGNYTIFVEVDGYVTEKRDLIVPETKEKISITILLERIENKVELPALFALSLSEASEKLNSAGFLLSRVIDSNGDEVGSVDFEKTINKDNDNLVLNQIPKAGSFNLSGTQVTLLVSAKDAIKKATLEDTIKTRELLD